MKPETKFTVVMACTLLMFGGFFTMLIVGDIKATENQRRCQKICLPNSVSEAYDGGCMCDLTKVVK